MFESLKQEVRSLGKPGWRPLLAYVAALHERSIRPAQHPFPQPWEELGPGYCFGPAFGHWDIVHSILDSLPAEPGHARVQIENNLAAQEGNGLVPGLICFVDGKAQWRTDCTHPPLWQVAVQDYCDLAGSRDLILQCRGALAGLIRWFETNRSARPTGFYYTDILNRLWESGVDIGVRFDDAPQGPFACVDATAHLAWLYDHAARWFAGEDSADEFQAKADALQRFLQQELFDETTGFFHDSWAVGRPDRRRLALEGMWPFVVGAATPGQAQRVIDENLLNPDRFFAKHPLTTVGVKDPKFELRMWRGPSWNSMTYWACRGCLRYGRPDAARAILEAALDDSAEQFAKTGTIWEFYHPWGGDQATVRRKPGKYDVPCRDYLGHNPVIAMARMWEQTR